MLKKNFQDNNGLIYAKEYEEVKETEKQKNIYIKKNYFN